MKTLFIYLALIVSGFFLSSCQKDRVPERRFSVMVSVREGSTKSIGDQTSRPGESLVHSIQVFFFYSDGVLEAQSRSLNDSVYVEVSKGEKKIFVLVNAPEIKGIKTISELLETESPLSDNNPSSFVMTSLETINIDSDKNISVNAERLASRVLINEIKTDFPNGSALASQMVTLKEIYLTNVAGSINYGANENPSSWYNKLGNQGELSYFLHDSVGLVLSEAYSLGHCFYTYPNNTKDDNIESEWSPRHTRLVLKLNFSMLGDCYYSLNLPVVKRNTSYEFENISIKGFGAESEEEADDNTIISSGISIKPWIKIDEDLYNEN